MSLLNTSLFAAYYILLLFKLHSVLLLWLEKVLSPFFKPTTRCRWTTIPFMYNSVFLFTSLVMYMCPKWFHLYNKVEHFMFCTCFWILCSSKHTESFPIVASHKLSNAYNFGFVLTSLISLSSNTAIWSDLQKVMAT